MKKTILVALAGALLMVPATAEAHTLSTYKASAAAKRVASDYSYSEAGEGEYVDGGVLGGARYCTRFSRHKIVCSVAWTWALEDGWEYDDGTTSQTCSADVTVSFVSRYSYRIRTHLHSLDCS